MDRSHDSQVERVIRRKASRYNHNHISRTRSIQWWALTDAAVDHFLYGISGVGNVGNGVPRHGNELHQAE